MAILSDIKNTLSHSLFDGLAPSTLASKAMSNLTDWGQDLYKPLGNTTSNSVSTTVSSNTNVQIDPPTGTNQTSGSILDNISNQVEVLINTTSSGFDKINESILGVTNLLISGQNQLTNNRLNDANAGPSEFNILDAMDIENREHIPGAFSSLQSAGSNYTPVHDGETFIPDNDNDENHNTDSHSGSGILGKIKNLLEDAAGFEIAKKVFGSKPKDEALNDNNVNEDQEVNDENKPKSDLVPEEVAPDVAPAINDNEITTGPKPSIEPYDPNTGTSVLPEAANENIPLTSGAEVSGGRDAVNDNMPLASGAEATGGAEAAGEVSVAAGGTEAAEGAGLAAAQFIPGVDAAVDIGLLGLGAGALGYGAYKAWRDRGKSHPLAVHGDEPISSIATPVNSNSDPLQQLVNSIEAGGLTVVNNNNVTNINNVNGGSSTKTGAGTIITSYHTPADKPLRPHY